MTKTLNPTLSRRRRSEFASCRRGGVGMLAISLFLLIVAAVGFGVDLTRLMLVRSRLQTAVDAAALVAGRGIDPVGGTVAASAATDAKALFWSNFGRTGTSTEQNNAGYVAYLDAVAADPTLTSVSNDTVLVQASASLKMTLMALFGSTSQTVSAKASAKRAGTGMELALVLDVTGSMGPNYESNGNVSTSSSIAALRTAANNLVDIVFGTNDTQPNLFVSVTQFAASVNIGKDNTGWLASGSLVTGDYGNVGWGGCVEARTSLASDNKTVEDQTDTPYTTRPFVPYLYKSTMDVYRSGGNTSVTGDNDWYYNYSGPNNALSGKTKITEAKQALADSSSANAGTYAVGPNLICPQAPILPLTNSKATVRNVINNILAVNARGGTTGNLGLQAGWWTISPNWSGLWNSPSWSGQGSGAPTANLPNDATRLPLPYNSRSMQKVVVYMTDGNNQWYDWAGGAPGAAPSSYNRKYTSASNYVSYSSSTVDADYTAYGRLSENRLGITPSSSNSIAKAKTEIDKRSTAICTKMKDAGIIIYTVILGDVDDATETLWKGCASKPSYYFNSPTKAALATAFQQIATQISSVRLTQ